MAAISPVAREDSHVLGRTVTDAPLTHPPGIERLVVKSIENADFQRYADITRPPFSHLTGIEAAKSVKQFARASDVMTVTDMTDPSETEEFPYISREWIIRGALLLLPSDRIEEIADVVTGAITVRESGD